MGPNRKSRLKQLAGTAGGVRHLLSTQAPRYREWCLGVHALDRDRPASRG